ncbi:NAD(P)H-binding protein [Nonomuraea sp. NPDC050556]|uniref:NAD(P)H-binding protein n=1 Tax=Nonomuraea sp. NPDC050556 TaxID=3364369 RepID=UPI00378C789F
MILVCGATGTVGREVVEQLRHTGERIRVLTRHPARAVFPPDVEVTGGDLGDPATLAGPLLGVRSVFLTGVGHLRAAHDRNLVEAAAGVRHIVQLSSLAVEERNGGALARWHVEAENALRRSRVGWTILRANSFMSNALRWAPGIAAAGVVRAPFGASPSVPVDPRDLAAVAVSVLLGEGHEGRTYPVTGPEVLTLADQVRVLSEVLGVELRLEEIDPAGARRAMLRNLLEESVDAVVGGRAGADTRARARVQPTVELLTRWPARTFEQWAGDHAAAFRRHRSLTRHGRA